jgi:NADH:ubiquinone oxidoreductase subunit 2 (subunit N)
VPGMALVAIIVLNTVLSAFYYFRIVRVMYLQPATGAPGMNRIWTRHPLGALLGCGCAVGLVLMFFLFGPLYAVTSRSAPEISAPVAASASSASVVTSENS